MSPSIRRRLRLFASSVVLIAAATLTTAQAAPQSVAEIANYRGADRGKLLEEGAKKEGSLLVYAIGTQLDPLFKRFQDKYPAVRFELFRAPTTDITRRVLEEYRAGRHVVDILDVTTGGLPEIRAAGILQPYDTPEKSNFAPEAMDPKGYWVFDYEGYIGTGFNTAEVKPEEVPQTWDDLLHPRWKGRMALSGQGATMGNWIGALLKDRDEAFIRKLGAQQPRVYQMISRAVANLVVSGEVPLSPQIYMSHMQNSAQQGAKVAWKALGGAYSNVNALALPAKAPHPHAAMLYIDFALSHEGQTIHVGLGNNSARLDLASADKPKKIYYLSEEPDYLQNFEKWTALGRDIFGKPLPDPNAKK